MSMSSKEADHEVWRLNKYIAHCGICSRRKAEDLVKSGAVQVNGKPELNPFCEILAGKDIVTYEQKKLFIPSKKYYLLLNKPKNVICTVDDENNRKTVLDLLGDEIDQRVYPIGRLDRHTTGLLLLTNDGELTQKLSHPKYRTHKVYEVVLDREFTEPDMIKLRSGFDLEDGPIRPDTANYVVDKNPKHVSVKLHSGRNRIVRRMFEHLRYEVIHLDRTVFAGLTKKNLPRGRYRHLTRQEVRNLKHLGT